MPRGLAYQYIRADVCYLPGYCTFGAALAVNGIGLLLDSVEALAGAET